MPLLVRVPANRDVVQRFGRYPRFIDLGDGRRTAVQRRLRRDGLAGREPQTQATLLALVGSLPGPVTFLDVGAHIGIYSLLIRTVFPTEHVRIVAFEPTPGTAAVCKRLFKRNRQPVELVEVAVADQPGRATLYVSDVAETSNSLVQGFRKSSRAVDVEVTTIDTYCREHSLAPDVIKIDVERMEGAVLTGALDVAAADRPAIVCELLPPIDDDRTPVVLGQLADIGYHLHGWRDGRWTECAVDQIVAERASFTGGDFLFSPVPLSAEVIDAIAAWLEAIAACTPDQNRTAEAPDVAGLLAERVGAGVLAGWWAHSRHRLARRVRRR